QGQKIAPSQVLITTGSQQGLDLVAKVLIDAGAPVAVETPTYLGALQAFAPYEPIFKSLASDGMGPLPEAIAALPHDAPGTRPALAHHPPGPPLPHGPAKLQDPARPRHPRGAPETHHPGRAARARAAGRRHPLRRSLVRRSPAGAAGLALARGCRLPRLFLEG